MSQSSPTTQMERLSTRQAKRAAKAEERRQKSDSLKDEGDAFFRDGDFHNALDRYQRAIRVHGPSEKPILLTDLAATYLQLGMHSEAHDAADRALAADPTSVKARCRRGMARKHMGMWTAADIDFRTLLTLDPKNKDAQAQLAFVEEKRSDPQYREDEEEDLNTYSEYEAPALEDAPQLTESLSESSDCEHTGNGIPCKLYNRTGCKNASACQFSHAPDEKSERDALGRNVCRYYLMGVCKFGERCSYLHSREYLLHKGWWSMAEWIAKERKRYDFIQMCNKAIADYHNQTKASMTRQTSKKNQSKGKKKHVNHASIGAGDYGSCIATANDSFPPASQVRQSPKKVGMKSRKECTPANREGYGLNEGDENRMFSFTGSEVRELCQGVQPWDEDAQ